MCASDTVCTLQASHITLQVGDVVVDSTIVGHGQRSAVGIIAEIQDVVAYRHPHQIITGLDVSVGLFVADPFGALAGSVIFHGPVQNIQLDRGNPGGSHVSGRVGNEAAIFSTVALGSHLYPQSTRGGITGCQVLKVVRTWRTVEPLVG